MNGLGPVHGPDPFRDVGQYVLLAEVVEEVVVVIPVELQRLGADGLVDELAAVAGRPAGRGRSRSARKPCELASEFRIRPDGRNDTLDGDGGFDVLEGNAGADSPGRRDRSDALRGWNWAIDWKGRRR